MKTKIIWIPAMLMILGVLVLHCGEDKAGPGDFCEKDSDCNSGLICRDNICQEPKQGDCNPPCQEGQTCFEGTCVTIVNPDDKDGDGSPDTEDCDDLNPGIYPGAYEYCDGADNDCDGLIDEDCTPCPDGAVQDCGTDLGECTIGTQTCSNGAWETCSGVGPSPEACDGKDNDCDGEIDEICPCSPGDQFACSVNQGICTEGVQTCDNGMWTACTGQLPQTEICDGLDNDCDGLTDEGFNIGYPCTGTGECGDGLVECIPEADFDAQCDSMPGGTNDASSPEACDNLDNDCDGLTDEEMEADSAENSCVLAQDLGGLPDDGSRIVVVGNLWPEGDEDWYKVTATDDVNEDLEDNCDRFHFKVEFSQNPAGLLLDVYVDGCTGEKVDCTNDTEYEHRYDFTDDQGGQPIGQCPCSVDPQEGMTVCSAENKVFFIRVHGPTASCDNYELTITNGAPP